MKAIKFAAALTAIIILLCGCGKQRSESSDSKSLTDKDSSVLRISVSAGNEPFEYTDSDGDIQGFDAALGMLIAERLGRQAAFLSTDSSLVLSAVSSGMADIAISYISNSAANKKNAALSEPYITLSSAAVVHSDNERRMRNGDLSLAEQIAVVYGSSSWRYLTGELGLTNITEYRNQDEAAASLLRGDTDMMLSDSYDAAEFISAYPEFVIINDDINQIRLSAALSSGSSELLRQVDNIIAEFKRDGTLMELRRAYISRDEELKNKYNSRLKALQQAQERGS